MKKRGLILCLTLALVCAGNVLPTQAATVAEAAASLNRTDDEENRFALAPSGIKKDRNGNMYIADRTYHVLRRRTKSGEYTVLAGKEGVSGNKDGGSGKARLNAPWDTVPYQGGWLISDSENHTLRLYKNDKLTTVAGTGEAGYKNATGKKTRFNRPTGLAKGRSGEVYVSDTGNNVIRRIDKNGKVTTYAGGKTGCADGTLKNARFHEPTGLYYYKGALYVADSGNHRICRIANGRVETVAGSAEGIEGDQNGSALTARLSNPQDIFLHKDAIYISDTGNACVRKLYQGKVTTVISSFSIGDGRAPAEPCALNMQNGKLYVGDIFTEELLEFKL